MLETLCEIFTVFTVNTFFGVGAGDFIIGNLLRVLCSWGISRDPEPPCLAKVSGRIFSFLFPLADDASEAATRLQTQRWLESLETDLNLASSDANAGASAKRPLDVKNLLGQQGSMPSSSVSRFSSPTSSGGSSCGDVASLRRPSVPTPSDVLEHIHARFSELAATTMAVANSAVTSETEARRYRTGGACHHFGVLALCWCHCLIVLVRGCFVVVTFLPKHIIVRRLFGMQYTSLTHLYLFA